MKVQDNEQQKIYIDTSLGTLMAICPICVREFGCNKRFHVYADIVGRRRQYYCSYRCFKERPVKIRKCK